jgi:hypothetical protein
MKWENLLLMQNAEAHELSAAFVCCGLLLALVARERSNAAILPEDVPPRGGPYNLALGVWFLGVASFRIDGRI